MLLPATADKRDQRTQTAAAFASDLRAIFDERARGDRDPAQYAQQVFDELDALVAAGQMRSNGSTSPPRSDSANAQTLFETALDFDAVLAGATETERPVWQRIVGPVLKYLTQFRSGLGVIVDALDESEVIGTSYGLQTFFNLFRRAIVPVVITMRTEFWMARRDDLTPGMSAVESTVQTLDVIELLPWTDQQIIEAARLRLASVRQRVVLAQAASRFAGKRLPDSVAEWIVQGRM